MRNIKTNRSSYSNAEKYDLNSILYVSSTQPPGCSPPVQQANKEGFREDLGAFSISAAVRLPYSCCRGCGSDCQSQKIEGVS